MPSKFWWRDFAKVIGELLAILSILFYLLWVAEGLILFHIEEAAMFLFVGKFPFAFFLDFGIAEHIIEARPPQEYFNRS